MHHHHLADMQRMFNNDERKESCTYLLREREFLLFQTVFTHCAHSPEPAASPLLISSLRRLKPSHIDQLHSVEGSKGQGSNALTQRPDICAVCMSTQHENHVPLCFTLQVPHKNLQVCPGPYSLCSVKALVNGAHGKSHTSVLFMCYWHHFR